MKIKKLGALLVSAALCAGMAAPAFAYGGEPVEEVEQPVLTSTTDEEDVVTVTDETSGALTPEGNLTLVDDYYTNYSDGSGQQFITLVSKSGNTFYLVIDRNAKGQQTVHFMNLVDEADLLSLMEDEDAEAYTAEKEAAAQAAQERKQAEEDAKKAAEEAEASGSEQTGGNKVTKYAATFLGVLALVGLVAGGGIYTFMKQKQKKQAEKEALDPDANYTEDKGDFEIPVEDEPEETDEEDDFEEFDFMMFSQLEDTRDVLFRILQNRELPLQERMTAAEQLAEQYQICMEEQREYDIDDLLRKYEKHLEEGTLSECVAESLAEKGVDAASFHAYDRQVKELAVLRGLERLRPEWDTVLDGTEKALYQNGETAYQAICEEFHRTWGAAGERRAEWENIGEQLLMFFVYTYFCGAVYDDMVCSKMELALFSVRWIQEILVARWLENGKTLSMHDIEELSWRYAREVEHSDDNLNALEDWLFETYAPEGCVLEEE